MIYYFYFKLIKNTFMITVFMVYNPCGNSHVTVFTITCFGDGGVTAPHMSITAITRWNFLQSLRTAVARRRMVHVVDTDKLYGEVTAMVAEYLRTHEQRESRVIEFRSPAQLRELVDLSLPEEAQSEEVVLQACRDALKYCVNTCECGMGN